MKELLYKAQEMIRESGCADSRLMLFHNIENNICFMNGKVDKQQRSDSFSLAVTLYIDGREGFFYTNVFDDSSLRSFLRQSVMITRMLAPDPARGLIDPASYYKGDGPDLHNYDPAFEALTIDNHTAFSLIDAASKIDGRNVVSVDTRYTDRLHRAHYLCSNGFEATEHSTRCTLSTVVSVKGEGDARPMDGWGQTRLFLNDLTGDIAREISETAYARTICKIGQRPVKPGFYTMVVESPVAGHLLMPLFSAMAGQALQQHSSFLEGKLGEKIGSELLDMVDNPHIPGTRGATYFDYDGAATKPMKLFDRGVLSTYFIDTPMGRKLGMEPTTQGIHHTIMTPSSSSLEDILKLHDECILITDFNGGNCNPVTGHFSYGVEGFHYRNGICVQPISGMNITGNMLDIWNHLVQVSNDADPYEADLIPSLVFEGVSFK